MESAPTPPDFDEAPLLLDEDFDVSGQDLPCILRAVGEVSMWGGGWKVGRADAAEM
jgi:hypothetical protein